MSDNGDDKGLWPLPENYFVLLPKIGSGRWWRVPWRFRAPEGASDGALRRRAHRGGRKGRRAAIRLRAARRLHAQYEAWLRTKAGGAP